MTRKVSLNCYHPYSIETCDHTPCFAELKSYACYIILVLLNLYRYDSLSIAKLAAPIPHCWTSIVHLVSGLASLSTTASSHCHGIIKHRRNIDCIAELTSLHIASFICHHTHTGDIAELLSHTFHCWSAITNSSQRWILIASVSLLSWHLTQSIAEQVSKISLNCKQIHSSVWIAISWRKLLIWCQTHSITELLSHAWHCWTGNNYCLVDLLFVPV